MQRIVIFIVLLAGVIAASAMMIVKNKKQPASNTGFAVVELFTSEGCSSCPPADDAVANLLDKYKNSVYVLGFHVDYWDYLGWKDAYSSAAYSRRQQQYGSAFHLNSVYTPQAIVNGTTEFTGSDTRKLYASVEQGLSQLATTSIEIIARPSGNKTVTVNYTLSQGAKGLLNIALVELHAQSSVQRGENSGKLLHHVNVVRDFKTINVKEQRGDVVLALPQGLTGKDCAVIAYIQDASTWKITTAASAEIK
ncbi:MAG TPA: DUF1223 domain-containing protein [Chitinophagaceae bacterium]|nr:DUF1223 domain-containing protein [Chitinophagaceae bacterium]